MGNKSGSVVFAGNKSIAASRAHTEVFRKVEAKREVTS